MSLTLRHSHVPGHPPWLQGSPIDAPRLHRGHHHHHDAPTPPPLLVLTTLRPGTGDALHKAARLAHTLGTGLRLAWCADEHPNGLSDPMARLQQRARVLRRRHALAVDLSDTPVRTRADAVRLARGASLACLADAPSNATTATARATLAERLLLPLLRAANVPVWVIHRAEANGVRSVHCLLRPDAIDAPLLGWAWRLAAQRPLRLVHVLPTALPADDPRDIVAWTVFDHMQRQRRLHAHHALDQLAAPLRRADCHQDGVPVQDLQATVLFGDVDDELKGHLARSAVGTLVVGHTLRRWWPWASLRARPLLHQADDTLVVPLPARSLLAALRRAWAGLLAAA